MSNREDPGIDPPDDAVARPSIGGAESTGGPGVLVGLFAKHWTPGTTKTRLAAAVGDDLAAAISQAFVETTLERVGRIESEIAERSVAYTPREMGEAFQALPAIQSRTWSAQPQSSGGLGQRMRTFLAAALRAHRAALLIGSDSPHLPLPAVVQAIEWLNEPVDGDRLVLGPSEDGGYWLIGVRGTLPPIFEGMPWSREDLFATTVSRLDALGWIEGRDYRRIDAWYDVDRIEDLQRMRRDLRGQDLALDGLADRLDALLGPLDEIQPSPTDDIT